MMPPVPTAPYMQELHLARSITREAGQVLAALRKAGNLAISEKGRFDVVTQADLASHEIISRRLAQAFAQDHFLSEEGPECSPFTGRCWVADPLDGTANFIHGQAHVAVSLALFEEGKPVLGVVHAPFQNETFWTIRDHGAFRNNTPLQITTATKPERALIGTGFPHDRRNSDEIVARYAKILGKFGDIRRLAAPALDICWVADGRLDGFIDRLKIWDIAAAGLIAEEAGAKMQRCSDKAPYPEPADGFDYIIAPEPIASCLQQIYGS